MFASDDEQLGLAENFFQEVAAKQPARELARGIVDQTDRSPELVLRAPDRRSDLGQAHTPDNVEVHVAPRALTPLCDRSKDECNPDAPFEWFEGRTQDFDHPRRLDHESSQFRKHGRGTVGPIVDPVTFDAPTENSSARQPRQIALETRGAQAYVLRKVCEVPPFLRVHERRRQDRLAGAGKERGEHR